MIKDKIDDELTRYATSSQALLRLISGAWPQDQAQIAIGGGLPNTKMFLSSTLRDNPDYWHRHQLEAAREFVRSMGDIPITPEFFAIDSITPDKVFTPLEIRPSEGLLKDRPWWIGYHLKVKGVIAKLLTSSICTRYTNEPHTSNFYTGLQDNGNLR